MRENRVSFPPEKLEGERALGRLLNVWFFFFLA